jgi:hypothetical protein
VYVFSFALSPVVLVVSRCLATCGFPAAPSEAGPPWVVDLSTLVPNAATELGVCVNPVPVDAGYVQYSETGNSSGSAMQSFSFQTSQQEAEKAVTAAAPCQAQAPALMLAPPPPAPVQQTAGANAPPLPPPAPIQTAENHKVAVIEAAEVLAPPPHPPSVGVGLAKNRYVLGTWKRCWSLHVTYCASL